MKIGLNATCLGDRPSGARQRFVGLYGELIKRMRTDEFVVFEPMDSRVGASFAELPNLSVRRTSLSSESRLCRCTRGLSYWPSVFSRERFDLFENFHWPLVKAPGCTTVLTIHDIRSLYGNSRALSRQILKRILELSINRAEHVITVSHMMKEEILNEFPQVPISVIFNGLDAAVFDQVSEFRTASVSE